MLRSPTDGKAGGPLRSTIPTHWSTLSHFDCSQVTCKRSFLRSTSDKTEMFSFSSSAALLKLALSLVLLCSVVVTDARPSTTGGQLRTNTGRGRTSAFLRQNTFASAATSSATSASQARYREINPSFVNRTDDNSAERNGSAKRRTDEDDSPLVSKRVGLVVRL